jgi:FMN phosphatase YigB (HAD superfamily)
MHSFADGFPGQADTFWVRFEDFYRRHFEALRPEIFLPEALHETLATIRAAGRRLVLATNPVFPLDALQHRLAWGGLEGVAFALITHIENMSFCKPAAGYYHQICRKIGCRPETCLMVGNDPRNDLAAASIGMQTYLTVDARRRGFLPVAATAEPEGGVGEVPRPDFEGPLAQLPEVLS